MRKRILALALSLIMVISLFTVAPISAKEGVEILKTDLVEEASGLLVALGVIEGYEDGSLGLENNITRAEFATMLARVLRGVGSYEEMIEEREGVVYKTDYDKVTVSAPFTDLYDGHWAYEDIEYLRQEGVIHGYPDGTFVADADILYEEAVKIVLSALGYDFMGVAYGGYPDGYLKAARNIELTKSVGGIVSVAATRQHIALLIFNALTVDYLTLSSVSGDLNIYEGGKTLLETSYGVKKVRGYLTATEDSGMASISDKADKDTIVLGDEAYTLRTQSDAVKDCLGYQINAYVRLDKAGSDKGELLSSTLINNIKQVKLAPEDIFSTDIDGDGTVVAYVDDKKVTYEIDVDNVNVLYNDVAYGRALSDETFDIELGEITLVSTNGDDEFDLVLIDKYIPMLVTDKKDYGQKVEGIIYDETATIASDKIQEVEISLDAEDEDLDITVDIYKADGTKGSFADIKVDTTIYIKKWRNHYNVEIPASGLVKGVINQKRASYSVIGNTKYEAVEGVDVFASFVANDNIIAGLTKDGYVFAAKRQTTASNLRYGLLMDVYEVSGNRAGQKNLEFKLMMTTGEIATYQAATNMKFTHYGADCTQDATTWNFGADAKNPVEAEEIIAILEGTATKAGLQYSVSINDADKRIYEQVIKYSVNADGAVTEMATPKMTAGALAGAPNGEKFTIENQSVKGYTINDGSVLGTPYSVSSATLFVVPYASWHTTSDDLYYATTMGTSHRNTGSTGILLFDVDELGNVGCAITGSAVDKYTSTGSTDWPMAVIEYFTEGIIEKDDEVFMAYEIGTVEQGSGLAVREALEDSEAYGYDFLEDSPGANTPEGAAARAEGVYPNGYFVGDILVLSFWYESGYMRGVYNEPKTWTNYEDLQTFYPIHDMIQYIIEANEAEAAGETDLSNGFTANSGTSSSGLYPVEVTFGKATYVKNGTALIHYGNGAIEALKMNLANKKAIRYDCATGYIEIGSATDLQEGDWAFVHNSKREFKMMVIFTNCDQASLDNIKQVENERADY